MPLVAGTRLGPYDIVAPIGKGGMGEVYRARDTKLDRDVAIKVLPEELAADEERVARFEREAKLLASLNHPNIASIYGFESNSLVLELVEGETLAERIQRGPIPVDEALAIAKQIADALEAGHEAGIIHRDLKPANIKVRDDGTVKVLDYGLAKALEGDVATTSDSELSQSPTLTRQGTQVGVILGTAAYMSPEQAKGKRVDKRTDVWAFGAVLYEMLTGKRAFGAEDVSETLASVIKDEPDLSETPHEVRRLLDSCLQKNPKERLRDIGDSWRLLGNDAVEGALPPRSRLHLPWLVAGLFAIIAIAAVTRSMRPIEAPRPVVRSSISLPEGVTITDGSRHAVAISPDGSHVVFAANDQLFVRALDEAEPTPIEGTEGAYAPFFSPDGGWIAFYASEGIHKVSIRGGLAVKLCSANGLLGARWHTDDTIVYGQRLTGITRVNADGGEPEVIVELPLVGEVGHGPQVLPGGNTVLFTLGDGGNWDVASIVAHSLETGERKVIVERGRDARYLPTGHLVFVREGVLLAAPFDVDVLEVAGSPIPVTEGILTVAGTTGAAQFSVSDNGTLVYVSANEAERNRRLAWVDRDGTEEVLSAPPRAYMSPRLSPDGSRVAVNALDEENDVWIWDLGRETLTRFTFDPQLDNFPVWTPDGKRLAFASNRDGPRNVYWKAAAGTGPVERLTEGESLQIPNAFTPDGTRLLFADFDGRIQNLHMLSLGGAVSPLLKNDFRERLADLSPNGRWMAYESQASGRFEIYVRPFPNVEDGLWLISKDGGRGPTWARDGRELFYRDSSGTVLAVDVETESGFTHGNPKELFGGYFHMSARDYDVSPDAERFLMLKAGPAGGEGIILVQNWFEELKRLVPTDR